MARKPNYRFERMERERNKAAKKAARQAAKKERTEQAKAEKAALSGEVDPTAAPELPEPGPADD